MKEPKRYLKNDADIFKVVGLSFKPETKEMSETEDKVLVTFKVGDWEQPIKFIPYFQSTQMH